VSPEVVWASRDAQAPPTDGADIAQKLREVWSERDRIIRENHVGLEKFVLKSKQHWLHFVGASE
jgi:hypothetical protein